MSNSIFFSYDDDSRSFDGRIALLKQCSVQLNTLLFIFVLHPNPVIIRCARLNEWDESVQLKLDWSARTYQSRYTVYGL